jgi:hypothetical protein
MSSMVCKPAKLSLNGFVRRKSAIVEPGANEQEPSKASVTASANNGKPINVIPLIQPNSKSDRQEAKSSAAQETDQDFRSLETKTGFLHHVDVQEASIEAFVAAGGSLG